ncbi:hypothetical protein JG636_18600, partial [Vibrio cholerae]|nr:hypothetical protein [Vibrio cholerae]
DDIIRDGHRRVVETGRAGHKHPVAINDGARVSDLLLELRAGRNKLAF